MEFKRFDIVRTKKNVALDDLYLKGGEEVYCCKTRRKHHLLYRKRRR